MLIGRNRIKVKSFARTGNVWQVGPFNDGGGYDLLDANIYFRRRWKDVEITNAADKISFSSSCTWSSEEQWSYFCTRSSLFLSSLSFENVYVRCGYAIETRRSIVSVSVWNDFVCKPRPSKSYFANVKNGINLITNLAVFERNKTLCEKKSVRNM